MAHVCPVPTEILLFAYAKDVELEVPLLELLPEPEEAFAFTV
jgi:hypothetical protein